jgi:hypothetical protein
MQILRTFQRSSLFGAGVALGMLALGLITGFATQHLAPEGQPLAMAAWMVVPIAIAVGGSIWWWRSIDEVARASQKTAWFWGGCFGLFVGVIAFVGVTAADPGIITRLFPSEDKPVELVALGILGAVAAQMIGYLLVWAGWWLSKR